MESTHSSDVEDDDVSMPDAGAQPTERQEAAVGQGRQLPDSFLNPAPGSKALKRLNLKKKRAVFFAIYDRLVSQIEPLLASHPQANRKVGWRAVCSHKFCNKDIDSPVTRSLIEIAARRWLHGKRDDLFNRPDDVRRRLEAGGTPSSEPTLARANEQLQVQNAAPSLIDRTNAAAGAHRLVATAMGSTFTNIGNAAIAEVQPIRTTAMQAPPWAADYPDWRQRLDSASANLNEIRNRVGPPLRPAPAQPAARIGPGTAPPLLRADPDLGELPTMIWNTAAGIGWSRSLPPNWSSLPQDQLIPILRNVRSDVLNAALQDMPPQTVSRIFEMLDLGKSGEMCSVCTEPSSEWSRFTRTCVARAKTTDKKQADSYHAFCTKCAIEWARVNVRPDGACCPFCALEKVPREECLADPFIMFSAKLRQDTAALIPFSAAQIPLLQKAVDSECHSALKSEVETKPDENLEPKVGRCPTCCTVSTHGNDVIRRCHMPLCAAEFCLRCNNVITPLEPRSRHLSGACITVGKEEAELVKGEGLAPCPKCGTQIWHGVGHACHSVKCPACAFRFCHACGTPYDQKNEHAAKCHCPIFCSSTFKCRCAKSCPECVKNTCEHCNGACPTCQQRKAAEVNKHDSDMEIVAGGDSTNSEIEL